MPEKRPAFTEHNKEEKNSRRGFLKKTGALAAGSFVGGGYYFWNKREQQREMASKPKEILWEAQFTNAFPKNLAEMSGQNREKFKADILRILKDAAQSDEKAKKFNEARIFLEASSDERSTSSWPGGNEGLSQARAEEIRKIYEETLKELETNDSETYALLGEFVKNKPIIQIAISPEHGRGVKSLEQLINPKTKRPYTKTELEQTTPEQKEQLYNQCRHVALRVELPAGDERQKQYKETVERLSAFKQIRILIDRSGSMKEENRLLTKNISDALVNNYNGLSQKSIEMGSFCSEIDTDQYFKIENIEDVKMFMDRLGHVGGDEKQLAVANQLLDRIVNQQSKDAEPTAVLVLTDEDINDFRLVDLEKLLKKCEQTNATVFFALINDETKLITTLDAKSLLFEFENYLKVFNNDNFFPAGVTGWKNRRTYILNVHEYGEEPDKPQQLSIDKYGHIKFDIRRGHLHVNILRKLDKLKSDRDYQSDKIINARIKAVERERTMQGANYDGEKIKKIEDKYSELFKETYQNFSTQIEDLKKLADQLYKL